MGIIYLLTDFGNFDPYVAILKNRILLIYPKANIIDLSHALLQYDIEFASWFLYYSFLNLGNYGIFCSIVDPGVGTERKGLVVKIQKKYFILPDNGLITLILDHCKKNNIDYEIYQIEEEKVLKITKRIYSKFQIDISLSSTFHGRDIFAPVSGLILKNQKISDFAKKIKEIKVLEMPLPQKIDLNTSSSLSGKIVYFDHFGNLFTNINLLNHHNKKIKLFIKEKDKIILEIKELSKTFAQVKKNDFLFYIGSFGFIEIARNQNSALNFFGDFEKIKNFNILLEVQ